MSKNTNLVAMFLQKLGKAIFVEFFSLEDSSMVYFQLRYLSFFFLSKLHQNLVVIKPSDDIWVLVCFHFWRGNWRYAILSSKMYQATWRKQDQNRFQPDFSQLKGFNRPSIFAATMAL